jgi:single-stranded-DNA-specific exonuclease
MVRSGTEEEKELLFKSFLKFKAFDYIYSTKRGHKQGETEQLVTQAVRTCKNVKTRQGKAQDDAMARLEGMIEDNSMMEHKVLLFLLEPGEVEPNVAGLVANKIMGKYQRPCAVLTRREREAEATPTLVARKYFSYEGSARGCDKADVSDFKDICEATGLTQYVAGHPGAFGLGILPEDIDHFLAATDAALKNMPDEPVYYVDYIYQNTNVNSNQILEIADLGDIWGKDVDESYVAIDGLKITSEMVTVYRKKNNTLKITLPNKLSVMLFNAPDDLCEKLENTQGYVEMDIVGKANKNEYMGWVTPQIFIEEYAITGESRYNF